MPDLILIIFKILALSLGVCLMAYTFGKKAADEAVQKTRKIYYDLWDENLRYTNKTVSDLCHLFDDMMKINSGLQRDVKAINKILKRDVNSKSNIEKCMTCYKNENPKS